MPFSYISFCSLYMNFQNLQEVNFFIRIFIYTVGFFISYMFYYHKVI